jgi:hypothetical protein
MEINNNNNYYYYYIDTMDSKGNMNWKATESNLKKIIN